MNIVVIGGISYDTIIDVDELVINSQDQSIFAKDKRHSIGGTGAGKAFTLGALGYFPKFITTIGRDDEAKHIKESLKERELDISYCIADQTTSHTNIMYGDGHRLSIFTQIPTKSQIQYKDHKDDIKNADLIFLNIDPFAQYYFKDIEQSKAKIVVDIHDYDEGNVYHEPFIKLSNILIGNAVNIPNHMQFLHTHVNKGKELVVLTKGKDGYIAMDKNKQIYKSKAIQLASIKDTNGAGDAFAVGLSLCLLETSDIKKALDYANICGAIACKSSDLFPKNINPDDFTI
ncbi:MAG: PfkB family carbohydrate kinase [Candidatus Izemoplasma sp.]|nr:PfkB family carbohydrate kinase [Candidatus Izemoplasma sp.]